MRVPLFWLHDYCDPGIGVSDLRIFYENDLRFLEQFG